MPAKVPKRPGIISPAASEIQRIDCSLEVINRNIEHIQDQTEQRVRLFLTIASAGVALIAFGFQFGRLQNGHQPIAAIVVLVILLMYGVETLHSLNWMILYIRESTAAARYLGRTLASYSLIDEKLSAISNEAEQLKSGGWYRRNVRGSLVEFMYLTNALLCTGIAGALGILLNWGFCLMLVSTLATLILSVPLQYVYSCWMRNIIPLEWVRKQAASV